MLIHSFPIHSRNANLVGSCCEAPIGYFIVIVIVYIQLCRMKLASGRQVGISCFKKEILPELIHSSLEVP